MRAICTLCLHDYINTINADRTDCDYYFKKVIDLSRNQNFDDLCEPIGSRWMNIGNDILIGHFINQSRYMMTNDNIKLL